MTFLVGMGSNVDAIRSLSHLAPLRICGLAFKHKILDDNALVLSKRN